MKNGKKSLKIIEHKTRGRPKQENTKKRISIRLDEDLLDKIRETGTGWQTRINIILRKFFLKKKK